MFYFRKALYLFVFVGYGLSHAGSYEDFFAALKTDNAAVIANLLARGFDPNTLDESSQHGLILAIKEPSPKAARVLINAPKINLNHLNASGESPLMLAAIQGAVDLAEKMIEKGADVNKTGWTPLHYAATSSQIAFIKLLLENHAYIDAESPNGSTPLMMAAMYGNAQAVQLLLDEGADPLLRNQLGLTALEFAQKAQRADSSTLLDKATRKKRATGTW